MNLKMKSLREAALKAAREIAEEAKAEGRNLTEDETRSFDEHLAKADALEARIKAADESKERFDRIASLNPIEPEPAPGDAPAAKSLGEHFAKEIGQEGLAFLKSHPRYTAVTSEFGGAKAATDPHVTSEYPEVLLTDVDRTVVHEYRRPAVVADLLGSGSVSGNAITYFVTVGGTMATRPWIVFIAWLAASLLLPSHTLAAVEPEVAFAEAYHQALVALVERRRDDARMALQRAEAIGASMPEEQRPGRRATPRLKALRYLVATGYAEYGQRAQAAQLMGLNVGEYLGQGVQAAIIGGEGGQSLLERLGGIVVSAQSGSLQQVRTLARGLEKVAPPDLDLDLFLAQAEMLALIQSGGSPIDHARFADVAQRLLPSGAPPARQPDAGPLASSPGSETGPSLALQQRLEGFMRVHVKPLSDAYIAQMMEDGNGRTRKQAPVDRGAADAELEEILALIEGLPAEEAERWRRELLMPLGMYVQLSGTRLRHPLLRKAGNCMAEMTPGLDAGIAGQAEWIQRCAPFMGVATAASVAQSDAEQLHDMSLAQLEAVVAETRQRQSQGGQLALRMQQRMVELLVIRGDLEAADALALQMLAATSTAGPEAQARARTAHALSLLALGEPKRALDRVGQARSLLHDIVLPEDARHSELLAMEARAQAMLADPGAAGSYRRLAADGLELLAAASYFQREGLRADLAALGPRFVDKLRMELDVPASELQPAAIHTAIVSMELMLANGQATRATDWQRLRDGLEKRFPGDIRLAALDVQLARLHARDKQRTQAAREARRAIARLAAAGNQRSWLHPRDPVWWSEPTRHVLGHAASLLSDGGTAHGQDADALFLAVQLAGRDEAGQSVRRMRARLAADPGTDHAIRRYEGLLAERAELSARLAEASPELADTLLAPLQEVVAQEQALARELQTSAPAYWRLARQEPVSVAQVRDALGADQAFIHYGWLGDTLWIVRVNHEGASARSLALTGEAAATEIAAFRRSLEPGSDGRFPRFDADGARRLHSRLLAPELRDLATGTTLLLVPSGPLHALPFAALVEGQRDDAYLIRQHPLMVSASPGAWLALRAMNSSAGRDRGFLGVGNPRLAQSTPRAEEFIVSDALVLRNAARRLADIAALPPLPDTETEIRRLEQLFDRPRSTLLLDDGAREQRLRELKLRDYDIIGFSTHGLLAGDVDGVGEAGLVLTPPPQTVDREDDGFLAASEIATLSLDAEWVLLAACNTGRVADGHKPGVGPLAQAFHYAGARNLLVTHWPVASVATLELVSSLVEGHASLGKARALQQAMVQIADSQQQGHPGYWAAFFLLGS